MIICFEGTPGSGKSYEAVRKITDNLKLGRTVYTNIDGIDLQNNRESIKSYCGLSDYELETRLIFMPHFQINEFWLHVKKGSVILIDEVHKWFSARDWASEKNKGFAEWASTHRHEGFDVILITQKLEKIDSHVRSLIEWTYRYKKLNMFGSLVQQKYKRASFCGDDTTGKPLDNKIYSYDKRIFHCYKSFSSDDVKELGIMKHSNILKHPVFLLIPLSLIAFTFLFFRSGFSKGHILGVGNKKVSSNIVEKFNPLPVPVPAVPAVLPPVSVAPSSPVVPAGDTKIETHQAKDDCTINGTVTMGDDIIQHLTCGSYIKSLKNGIETYRKSINGGVGLPMASAAAVLR